MRIVILCGLLAAPALAGADDTTPLNCEQHMQGHPVGSWYREFCANVEADTLQEVARIRGQPRPSRLVLDLPDYGTAEAKKYGVACMSGLGMRRLSNGWDQLVDRDGNFQRCRNL